MIAACERFLHQPINDVLDWDVDLFFTMFAQIEALQGEAGT